MTFRRIKDPAGLMPDRIDTDLDGDCFASIANLLGRMTPVARIRAIRRDHAELEAEADELLAELDSTGGAASPMAMARLAQLETRAIYYRAAPAAIEVANRRVASAKGGQSRKTPVWHAELIAYARTLSKTGRQAHELTGQCARKFGKKDDAVRRVLQGAGLVPKRKSRAE